MLFLRYVFNIFSIIILLAIVLCFTLFAKHKIKNVPYLKNLQICSFCSVALCFVFYLVANKTAANIVWALYLVQMEVLLLGMTNFIAYMDQDETGSFIKKKNRLILKIAYYSLLAGDTVLLLSNFKTSLVFEISPVIIDDVFTSWTVTFKPLILVHVVICLSAQITMIYILVKYIIISHKIKRPAYITSLIVLSFTLVIEFLYFLLSNQILYNFSAIFLAVVIIILFLVFFYTAPRYVQKNLMIINCENVSDAIICFDENNRFTYGNKSGLELYKNKDVVSHLEKYIHIKNDVYADTEKIEIDNSLHHFKVEFRRIRDQKERNCGCYIKLMDCTEEVKAMEIENYKAIHDELTGLYNRDFFFKEMSRILGDEPDVPRCLICTDIKDFKIINEIFGSKFGDRLLVRQAEMLMKANYPGTIWGRISGDRYAMLIKKSDFNPELAEKNSNSIIEMENEVNFKLVIYISVYEITDPSENVHKMYDKATLAIKNIPVEESRTLVYCDENIMNKIMAEKSMVSEFDNALASGQFEMYLQPQISTASGKCTGAEALVRWNHPKKGMMYPGEFIKVFEKTDQIYKLDFFIWEKAAQTLAYWKEKNIDLTVSVNVSGKDFYYADLYDFFTKLVQKYDISPKKLNLEITESVINKDKEHCLVLQKLREYGFIIEMDDFGSAYSSLNALQNVSMDVLKLDMEFLRKSEDTERSKLIVSSIVKMAKSLNMTVISEGVETQAQADLLKDISVDVFQGYLYSPPVTVKEFEQKYMEVKL